MAKKKSWATCGKKFATWRPPEVFYIQNDASDSWSDMSTVSGCLRRFDMASLLFECCCRSQFCRSEGSKIAVQPCCSEIIRAKKQSHGFTRCPQMPESLSINRVLTCVTKHVRCEYCATRQVIRKVIGSYTQVKSSERETVPSWCLVSARPAIQFRSVEIDVGNGDFKTKSYLAVFLFRSIMHWSRLTTNDYPDYLFQRPNDDPSIKNTSNTSNTQWMEHHLLTALPDVAHGVRQQLLGSRIAPSAQNTLQAA